MDVRFITLLIGTASPNFPFVYSLNIIPSRLGIRTPSLVKLSGLYSRQILATDPGKSPKRGLRLQIFVSNSLNRSINGVEPYMRRRSALRFRMQGMLRYSQPPSRDTRCARAAKSASLASSNSSSAVLITLSLIV